jgi:hypothetical protein
MQCFQCLLLNCFEIGLERVAGNLNIDVIAKRDDIRAGRAFRGEGVLNLSLAQEAESTTANDGRRCAD